MIGHSLTLTASLMFPPTLAGRRGLQPHIGLQPRGQGQGENFLCSLLMSAMLQRQSILLDPLAGVIYTAYPSLLFESWKGLWQRGTSVLVA